MYIRNNIPYTRQDILECDGVESLWVLIRDKCMPRQFSHMLIGAVYHPPNACQYYALDHIINCVDDTLRRHPYAGVMILGDFNRLDDIQLRNYPLKQVVKRPTRGTAILDKIFTNMYTLYRNPNILAPTSLSDHCTIIYEPNASLKYDKGRSLTLSVRTSKHLNKLSLVSAITEFDWTPLFLQFSCQTKFDLFQTSIVNLINQHLPFRMVKRHTSDKPWITDFFRHLIHQRQRAFMSDNTLRYRMLRNKVNRLSKSIRANYYQEQVQSLLYSDPRRWWRHTKALSNFGKTPSDLSPMANLLTNGSIDSLANDISSFFESGCRDLEPLDMSIVPTHCIVPEKYIISVDSVTRLLSCTNVSKDTGPGRYT